MSVLAKYSKDPDSTLDFSIDWADWIGTDTISLSKWIIPGDLTITNQSNSSTKATVWLKGGVAGKTYYVVNRITTSGGRVDDRTLEIRAEHK